MPAVVSRSLEHGTHAILLDEFPDAWTPKHDLSSAVALSVSVKPTLRGAAPSCCSMLLLAHRLIVDTCEEEHHKVSVALCDEQLACLLSDAALRTDRTVRNHLLSLLFNGRKKVLHDDRHQLRRLLRILQVDRAPVRNVSELSDAAVDAGVCTVSARPSLAYLACVLYGANFPPEMTHSYHAVPALSVRIRDVRMILRVHTDLTRMRRGMTRSRTMPSLRDERERAVRAEPSEEPLETFVEGRLSVRV
ncbi:hypothetical protein CYMTET_47293 [Cymbomonas tetramitiformis]|uniref:Uncharacterized protein n=1 Tax=Cymbomonas tetramitiformis TaxID=36881 RepID=A0AAE0EWQ0_9CHLO|nr:hypothetical protein CYMTET_47293 [Cymbomonas tetramitiformis]